MSFTIEQKVFGESGAAMIGGMPYTRTDLPMKSADTPWMRFLLASLLYISCVLIFFHPNLFTLTTNLIGPPEDNMNDLWNVWYSQQLASFRVADWFSTRLLFFPEGTSLLYQSFSYSNLVVIRLIRAVFQLPPSLPVLVGLHNGLLLASFYFAGLGAFYLAYHFTGQFWAAWIGGFIFAFSPFHFAHSLHHMGIATIQYIPLFVLCVLRLEETHSLYYRIGAIIWFSLGAFSYWYYLFYNLFFVVFFYLYRAIQVRKLIVKALLCEATAILGGSLILLSPLLLPMMLTTIGNSHVYEGGQNEFVADLVGLFVFHPYHLAADWVAGINTSLTGNAWEMSVYLGVVNVSLLLWSVIKQRHISDPVMRWCLWGMLVFTLFAGGRYLHIYGATIKPVALPTKFLEYLPFLRNLRTPSRAIVYVYLFLGVAVARILSNLQSEQFRRPGVNSAYIRWRLVGTMAVSLAIVLDFCSISRASTPVTCPPAYSAIAENDTSWFGILDFPMGSDWNGNLYMMYQLCHGRPIVHAKIARKLTKTLSDLLRVRDTTEQMDLLKENRVKYIVVHKRLLSSELKARIHMAIKGKHYPLLYQDSEQAVFQVY